MSEKNNVISPELWAPLEQEEKNAEKMERPSLTFLQDKIFPTQYTSLWKGGAAP